MNLLSGAVWGRMAPLFPKNVVLHVESRFKRVSERGNEIKDKRKISTLRLIKATLHDRDIASRSKGNEAGISDDEILQMLTTMIRQRRESIAAYEQGGRIDLAASEQAEIEIISEFLPKQFTEEEIQKAVSDTIEKLGADGLKDMGRTMAELKKNYAGKLDFGKASVLVKAALN